MDLNKLLEDAYRRYAVPDFILYDPISIPHRFTTKGDIEVSAFLTATIAWGQRVTILNNAERLLERMDHAPADFIKNHKPADRKRFAGFVHRTFSEVDAMFFVESLQCLYSEFGGLESAFGTKGDPVRQRLSDFHDRFFDLEHLPRTRKHVSDPRKGSSAKRLNM